MLFKLALALHMSLRFAEANDDVPAGVRALDAAASRRERRRRRCGRDELPPERPRPDVGDRLAEHPALHAAVRPPRRGWPERTIVPSLAERWEIADDGLRYVFHLREGLTLVRRRAAHRARRRVRHQARARPASARLVGGDLLRAGERRRTTTSAATPTPTAIGVRALDDRTVEFRLAAPAPYFMSVMNRPDGGPQPRHAIERDGDDWTQPERQVVSGAVRGRRARRTSGSCCERRGVRERPAGQRRRGRVRPRRASRTRSGRYARGELDMSPSATRRGWPT